MTQNTSYLFTVKYRPLPYTTRVWHAITSRASHWPQRHPPALRTCRLLPLPWPIIIRLGNATTCPWLCFFFPSPPAGRENDEDARESNTKTVYSWNSRPSVSCTREVWRPAHVSRGERSPPPILLSWPSICCGICGPVNSFYRQSQLILAKYSWIHSLCCFI